MRTFVLALAISACAAFQAPATLRAASAERAASPTMKHNEYFQRVSRAESGRMRLCVFRCAAPAGSLPVGRRGRVRGPPAGASGLAAS